VCTQPAAPLWLAATELAAKALGSLVLTQPSSLSTCPGARTVSPELPIRARSTGFSAASIIFVELTVSEQHELMIAV